MRGRRTANLIYEWTQLVGEAGQTDASRGAALRTGAVGECGAGRCAAEIDFAGLKFEGAVEDHFDGGSAFEDGVGTASEEDGGQTGGGSGGGSDARAHAIVAGGHAGESADGGAGSCGFGDGLGIATLIATALDFAFALV